MIAQPLDEGNPKMTICKVRSQGDGHSWRDLIPDGIQRFAGLGIKRRRKLVTKRRLLCEKTLRLGVVAEREEHVLLAARSVPVAVAKPFRGIGAEEAGEVHVVGFVGIVAKLRSP